MADSGADSKSLTVKLKDLSLVGGSKRENIPRSRGHLMVRTDSNINASHGEN